MALRTRPTQFRSATTGVATEQLTATSRLVSYLTGIPVQPNKCDRRRQRLRARVGHPPGRLPEEPAHLRDHDPGVGRPVRLDADARQALRSRRVRRAAATCSGIHVEPETLDLLYGEAISLADQKKQVTDADLLALAEHARRPGPAARPARALGGRQPPGRVELRQRLALLRGQDLPGLRRRQRAGRRAAVGGRQRARADHRRAAAAGRLSAPIDRLRARTRRARRRSRSPRRPATATCRRSSPATGYPRTWSRRQSARLPGGGQQAHRRAPGRGRRDRGGAPARVPAASPFRRPRAAIREAAPRRLPARRRHRP